MRIQVIAAAAVVMLCALGASAAQTGTSASKQGTSKTGEHTAPATTAAKPAAKPVTLTGAWKSAPDETPLTTDLQKSVWGPNAKSVRTVDLTVNAAGTGSLKVTTKIVDGKGKTLPASTTIEEAQFTVGTPQETIAGVRTEYETKVLGAERKYPDDPSSKWPLDGLRVKLATIVDSPPDTIEIRFDTPEGRGSFWATLTRVRRASPSR